MLTKEKIARRFNELEEQGKKMKTRLRNDNKITYDIVDWQQWFTSIQNLIQAVFGESSPYCKNLQGIYVTYNKSSYWYVPKEYVEAARGIFNAAKDDFEGGYLFSVEASLSGEILEDFVKLAKAALHDGSKDVAIVLACAALEDALKRYATLNGVSVDDKTMQEVVNSLKSNGLVTGAQKSLLDTMPKIRNYALHANWDKITIQDAGSVIGFVEQFLLSHFSS